MRHLTRIAVLLVLALMATACAADEEPVDLSTVEDQIQELAIAIENSAASDELQAEWSMARAELESAIDQAEDSLDPTAIQSTIDRFQAALDERSDEVGLEVVDAWNSLRLALDAASN